MTHLEALSEAVHEGWMESKRRQGVASRRSESGEELMVPYAQLSEAAKDLDRQAARSVLDAIERAGLVVVDRSVLRHLPAQ